MIFIIVKDEVCLLQMDIGLTKGCVEKINKLGYLIVYILTDSSAVAE